MPARLVSPPSISARRRVTSAAAAALAGATALTIALPTSSADAAPATPTFGAVAGSVFATLDTAFLQGSGPSGSSLASVAGVFGESAATFSPTTTPQSSGSAIGFVGTSTSNGTQTQLASTGGGQTAPPANPDPVSGSAKALSVEFPGGGTFFDTSAVKYTASAQPVDSSAGKIASATTTAGSFDTLPEFPDPSTAPPAQSKALADAEATISAAVARVQSPNRASDSSAPGAAKVQIGGFFPSASGGKTSSSVSQVTIGGAPASAATASVEASTFSAGGFTFVVPIGSLTSTATGSAGSSGVVYQAPAVTYSGPNVAAGTPLPAAGVTISEPNLTIAIKPGALKQTNTGTAVSAQVAVLSAAITITDGTTPLLVSTSTIGALSVNSFAPAVVATPSPTGSHGGAAQGGAPELPDTGAATHGLLLTGSLLVLAGGVVVFFARRRRPAHRADLSA